MKIRFADDVLAVPVAWHFLDMIVFHLSTGRHIWDIPNSKAIRSSRWMVGDPPSHWTRANRAMLEKSTTRNAHRSGDKGHAAILTVSMVESPPWTLSPADAYE